MAYKETIKHLRDLLCAVTHDLEKAENGNKAAAQRVRTGTVKLEKIAKSFRKESIRSEKGQKSVGHKRPAKKKIVAKKARAKVTIRTKAKAHALKSHKTVAKSRALSFKKPSAKLPIRRAGAR